MKKAKKTNVQVVKQIMEYGSPMKQVWIMDVLCKASKAQAFAPAPDFGENAFINGEGWKAAAVDIYNELKAAGYI
jgi:hypothetical protein